MHIFFVLIGGLSALAGLLIVFMFPGDEALGLSLVGIGCFCAVLGRMAQASNQHEEIINAWRGKLPERHEREEARLSAG